MAIKNTIDQDVTKQDVDLSKSDIPQYYESDEINQFKLKPMVAAHNFRVDNEPLKTEEDQYAEATRIVVS